MPRETTNNYGASTSTQFAWATTDQDLFDREFDLYRLAQAVEFHTHTPTRGLPIGVGGVGADAVNTAAIAALAVTTPKLADLSVTNAKLGEGAVTRNKITWPLVQPTNDMAGGFRQQNVAGNFALGFYMDAAGLAVFGSGTPAAIPASLILGQAGQVSVGTLQGAGKFNVFQTADTNGSGLRLYHPNTFHYISLRNDVIGRLCIDINANSFFFIHPTAGYVTLGAAANDSSRLTLVQTGEDSGQGFRLINPTLGQGLGYVVNDGSFVLQSLATAIKLQHAVAALSPFANLGSALGQTALRWSTLFAQHGDFSGNVTVAGTLSATGGVTGGVFFPLQGILAFETVAQLTAAGANFARYTEANGRMLIGDGTAASPAMLNPQTFTAANNYGTDWAHVHAAAGATGTLAASVTTGAGSVASGGGSTALGNHGHAVSGSTDVSAAFPAMRAVVWARRTT